MNGYVKPFFTGMKVYDPEQDKQKSFFHKLYEMIVGGLAHLLENKQTNDVATQADISGPVGGAKASVGQIIARAFENAFVKAILPGFEKQIERLRAKH
jgi:ATP-dependent Lon protease